MVKFRLKTASPPWKSEMGKSRPCKSPSRSGIGEAKDVKAKLGKYLKTLPFKRHQGGNNLMYTDTLPKPGARQKGCASSKNMLSRQVKRVNHPCGFFRHFSKFRTPSRKTLPPVCTQTGRGARSEGRQHRGRVVRGESVCAAHT